MKSKSAILFKELSALSVFVFLLLCLSHKAANKFQPKQGPAEQLILISSDLKAVNSALPDVNLLLKGDPSIISFFLPNQAPANKQIAFTTSSFIKRSALLKKTSPDRLYYLLFGLRGGETAA